MCTYLFCGVFTLFEAGLDVCVSKPLGTVGGFTVALCVGGGTVIVAAELETTESFVVRGVLSVAAADLAAVVGWFTVGGGRETDVPKAV